MTQDELENVQQAVKDDPTILKLEIKDPVQRWMDNAYRLVKGGAGAFLIYYIVWVFTPIQIKFVEALAAQERTHVEVTRIQQDNFNLRTERLVEAQAIAAAKLALSQEVLAEKLATAQEAMGLRMESAQKETTRAVYEMSRGMAR